MRPTISNLQCQMFEGSVILAQHLEILRQINRDLHRPRYRTLTFISAIESKRALNRVGEEQIYRLL
jgi:hypothetical protein